MLQLLKKHLTTYTAVKQTLGSRGTIIHVYHTVVNRSDGASVMTSHKNGVVAISPRTLRLVYIVKLIH